MNKFGTAFSAALIVSACLFVPGLSGARAAESSVHSADQAQSDVEAISRARFKALVARDSDYLKHHYTSDFQAVGTDGKLVDIRFLEWVVKNAPKDVNFEPFGYLVMVSPDGRQAVAFHKTHDTWDGQHSDVAYTEVFVKHQGQWLLRFEQYGEIQLPEPPKS